MATSSSSLLSVGGLASGLDTNSIIDGLVTIEKQSIVKMQSKQDAYNLAITTWGTLQASLSTVQGKGKALSVGDNFDKFLITINRSCHD